MIYRAELFNSDNALIASIDSQFIMVVKMEIAKWVAIMVNGDSIKFTEEVSH